MKILFSPECLEYSQTGHPESPERIRSTHTFLKEKGYTFIEPQPCCDEDILRVHSPELLQGVKRGNFFDSDTPVLPKIFDYALLSAGSAILASETALKEGAAFSLMRPPGHHATKNRVMGFCYFNNIAVAMAKHVEENPGDKGAILDIDCHHGNGTEDIFLGNGSVLYVSLHQSPLYPGTGMESHKNVLNFPLPPSTAETDYLDILHRACQKIADFDPILLGVSAGFDTYKEDPLTQLNLEVSTYRRMGKIIADLRRPTFIVMEGGYSRDLPECVFELLSGLDEQK
jgi:acetoin utilization deacetylase AcuC-like enzyme